MSKNWTNTLFDASCDSIQAVVSNGGSSSIDIKTLIKNVMKFNRIIQAFTRKKRDLDVIRNLVTKWEIIQNG